MLEIRTGTFMKNGRSSEAMLIGNSLGYYIFKENCSSVSLHKKKELKTLSVLPLLFFYKPRFFEKDSYKP